jgi:hypothetical protein
METSWRKDGESLPFHQELFVIANVSVGDEGSYSCLVTSPLDHATQEWQVAVVDPAFLTHFTDYRLVLEGAAVQLPCQASGVPPPSVAWSREGGALESGPDGSLSWEAVGPGDAGEYQCQATNTAGTDIKVASLVVAAPTTLQQSAELVVERDAGQAVTLECRATVDPALEASLTWAWTRDGEEVQGGQAELFINYLQAQHG